MKGRQLLKKLVVYGHYFLFIAWHWNLPLALFTVYHEIKGEKKYGISSTAPNNLKRARLTGNHAAQAEMYQASNYYLLQQCFDYLQQFKLSGVVDLGCGKGRILAVAAFYHYRKIQGVEFAAELCAAARQNLQPLQQQWPHTRISVLHQDAAEYEIAPDDCLFFLSNPFKELVMLAVIGHLLQSAQWAPRNIYVAYINPQYRHLFLHAGFEEIRYIRKMRLVEASILRYNAAAKNPTTKFVAAGHTAVQANSRPL